MKVPAKKYCRDFYPFLILFNLTFPMCYDAAGLLRRHNTLIYFIRRVLMKQESSSHSSSFFANTGKSR